MSLTKDTYDLEQVGPGPFGEDEHVASDTETIYRGSIIMADSGGDGVRKAAASGVGNPLGFAYRGVSATTGVTKVKFQSKGRFRIKNLNNAVTRANALGKLFYFDISTGSDDPADLLSDAAAGTGDIAFARCVDWKSTTEIHVEIGTVEPATHA